MKIKKTFTLTTGSVDSMMDIIMPGCMKLPISEPLKILDHFDASKQIGIITEIKQEGNNTIATGMFDEDVKGLYPAIGFKEISWHLNSHGGKTFDQIELICVGINPAPNADPNVKPIE